MVSENKRSGTRDESYDLWSYPEVFHRAVRYGADDAKRHYDSRHAAERHPGEPNE